VRRCAWTVGYDSKPAINGWNGSNTNMQHYVHICIHDYIISCNYKDKCMSMISCCTHIIALLWNSGCSPYTFNLVSPSLQVKDSSQNGNAISTTSSLHPPPPGTWHHQSETSDQAGWQRRAGPAHDAVSHGVLKGFFTSSPPIGQSGWLQLLCCYCMSDCQHSTQ
jgi:hypothetical protein